MRYADASATDSRKRRPPRTLYRGDPGMWSWVLHRITGATIFFFLFVHVLDTALVRVSPQAYNEVVDDLQDPDRRADGVRPGRRGAVPRAQRHPGHPDRLLAAGPPLPAADAVDRRASSGCCCMVPAGVVIGIHMAEHFR